MKAPILFALAMIAIVSRANAVLDSVAFGDSSSETAHHFSGSRTEKITGGLAEPARLLEPLEPASWEGGRISFSMAVDPTRQNYATVKFWGSDATRDMLVLFCEGKQIGYRHLGDIDVLDIASGEPNFLGRFFYVTTPLPENITHGKTSVQLEIRSYGPIWGYASTFDKYQGTMTQPSRGIYRLYTHTEETFAPSQDEKQGAAPKDPAVAKSPGAEVLEQLKDRVNREIDGMLKSKSPCSQMQMQLLARAYDVKWTHVYQNAQAIEQLVKGLDALFVAYRKNPELAQAEPSTWNPDWFGLGVCGEIITLRRAELALRFDETISDGATKKIARRAAYAEMLVACRDWHRTHRRLYTNQTMLNDLNGIYRANRGIAVLAPDQALSEKDARRYLYESVGLEPWRDSDPEGAAPEQTVERAWQVGTNYWQLTEKGLTRELGYVGSYGEVVDLVCDIYNATRPARGEPGDERIKSQLIKIAHARSNFRYPSLDEHGDRIMRLEQVVGWRDNHFPGYLVYGQRATRDACAFEVAAITLDPMLVGIAQQMIADNQFFISEIVAMDDRAQPLRTTIGRLQTPDEYETILTQPPSLNRLPMTPGQPDFVFSDEQDGVVAIKNGDEILYVSLYWRARNAVNFLARVHYTTPAIDRIAVVYEHVEFTPSGLSYTRPDWINFGFGNGGPKYPVKMDSAHAGEKLPIAKIPSGLKFKPGDESVYAGKGDFYTLRYGDYLIGMNLSTERTFELKPPAGVIEAKDLVSRRTVQLARPLNVPPRSTVVLWFGKSR